jgi:probable HAF family extracellular repeat protein
MRPSPLVRAGSIVGSLLLSLAACGSDSPLSSDVLHPASIISDGSTSGNPHFFFLPPMVRAPEVSGTFDGTRSPVVRITEEGSPLVELSASIPEGAEQYQAIWHTDEFNLDPAKTYRITVLFREVVLGFADVDVVATGGQLKNVNTGEYIPLLDGRTLPIKFRIEVGAVRPAVTIIDLGTLGGSFSGAAGINDVGQVVGGSSTASGQFHAFLWDGSAGMTDLGTLGGTTSSAYGINDAGQVVGYSSIASGETHAFRWDAATGMTDLGTLGGPHSEATAINNGGQVVGGSYTAAGQFHAFLWDAATGMTDLGTFIGPDHTSHGFGINDGGQVTGDYFPSSAHAFRWDPATGLLDLGSLPTSFESLARGINAVGQVVGMGFLASQYTHAFRWDAATGLTDLGTFTGPDNSSHGFGIDDAGQVVGYSFTGFGERHAFLWAAATGMTDLGTLEVGNASVTRGISGAGQSMGASEFATFASFSSIHTDGLRWDAPSFITNLSTFGGFNSEARGINNAGQVVGFSELASGETHATLWTIVK